jgi:acyl CoA:acetate/3-ketoacid CoA transferase alpha subunit
MNELFPDPRSALADLVKDGMTIMAGGFGLCGIPEALIEAIRDSGAKDLTIISNNAGGWALVACLIPGFDGAIFSVAWREALWARFFTAAPPRLRRSVAQSRIVKKA